MAAARITGNGSTPAARPQDALKQQETGRDLASKGVTGGPTGGHPAAPPLRGCHRTGIFL
jgi:hypothetical protein